MRIGIDVGPAVHRPYAGVGRYVAMLVRHLLAVAPQNEYHLLYTGSPQALPPEFRQCPSRRLAGSPRAKRLAWLLSHWLRRPLDHTLDHIDLFHATDGTGPRLERIPTVATVHDLAFWRLPATSRWPDRLYLSQTLGPTVGRAAVVIADSWHTKNDLLRAYGLPPQRISVVYPGVAEAFADQSGPDQETLSRLGVAPPFVLSVGTREPRKNLGLLLGAFARFGQRRPEYTLVLVGGAGWVGEALLPQGEAGRVQVLNTVPDEDLAALYRAAAFFVYPSLYEGFGFPPLEAMTSGTPVLVSRTSSLPEVVGEAGRYFDPSDEEALLAGMLLLADDPSLRDELRRKGIERASLFSWRRAAQETLEVYHRALGSPANR